MRQNKSESKRLSSDTIIGNYVLCVIATNRGISCYVETVYDTSTTKPTKSSSYARPGHAHTKLNLNG